VIDAEEGADLAGREDQGDAHAAASVSISRKRRERVVRRASARRNWRDRSGRVTPRSH
jgi:hypothetical protein